MSLLQQLFQGGRAPETTEAPRAPASTGFGSNQERLAQLAARQGGAASLAGSGTLRVGSEGDAVRGLQQLLGMTGADVDGSFGPATKARVIAWQQRNGLSPDGVVGPATIAAMTGGIEAPAAAAPTAEKPTAAAPTAEKPTAEASSRKVDITRTLRLGSEGEDVKSLQQFLGMTGEAVTGTFDAATRAKVIAWQKANRLSDDGIVGTGTIAAMNGEKRLYGHSRYHDADKFVPAFPMMAYHESGSYRTRADPYAVGTITNPDKDDDLGGKTYGTYQFETFVHAGGDTHSKAAKGSTAARFSRWEKNPYSAQLSAVVDKHGVGSAEFDALWKKLTAEDNKAFGKAQQDFLRHDKGDKAVAWMKRAGLSQTVQEDDAFFDLVLGTLNHVGTLANATADHLAAMQKKSGRSLTVEEAAVALTEHKLGRVDTWFKSSPKAHAGIESRFKAEQKAFQ
jgi:peptidoglycan hydrolase-like protein with peptidoglycan-binding domain